MDKERFEYLKRAIKRTYKRYTKERTDGKAELSDVLDFFNIPIDKTRIEDYSINNIDFKVPSIEVKDNKNGITYNAAYTSHAELLNYSGVMQFNSVISTSDLRKEETLYFIGDKVPIITKMTFSEDGYDLVFEREMPHCIGFFQNHGVKMTVRYLKDVYYNGENVKQLLFNKIYKRTEEDGNFEQMFTYGPMHFIKYDDTQDKYAYIKKDGVIYGIQKEYKEGSCDYFQGICFENAKESLKGYFPLNMEAKDYPLLKNNNVNSAVMFKIGTSDMTSHNLQIYKINDLIKIIYQARKYYHGENHHIEVIANDEYNLQSLVPGTITSEEISNVISLLEEKIKNELACAIASKELRTFSKKINIRKGVISEKEDLLSPKLFIDKSFDEICDLVSKNKDEYFNLIREQFKAATNIGVAKEKGQVKVLKPNNSQK